MTDDAPIRLDPVDRVEVTVVVDNFVDLLMAGSDGVRRFIADDFGNRDQLIAEHGFSALITVQRDGRRNSVLYDGGLTPTALGRNLDVLERHTVIVRNGHDDCIVIGCLIAGERLADRRFVRDEQITLPVDSGIGARAEGSHPSGCKGGRRIDCNGGRPGLASVVRV